jgi:hypothetical protein
MADINKALAIKKYIDPKNKMPTYFYQWLNIIDRKKAELLPLTQGQGIDHFIKLEKNNSGREKEVP